MPVSSCSAVAATGAMIANLVLNCGIMATPVALMAAMNAGLWITYVILSCLVDQRLYCGRIDGGMHGKRGMNRFFATVIGSCLLALLGGCQTTGEQAAVLRGGRKNDVRPCRSRRTFNTMLPTSRCGWAMEHFGRGSFGLAERYFRDAVEKAPRDATAWVGLAASYDRLRRFDLADQAYAQAIKLTGETVQILNNQGYSLMLRGDLDGARRKFLKSYEAGSPKRHCIEQLRVVKLQSPIYSAAP